jgi:hypothetical protein
MLRPIALRCATVAVFCAASAAIAPAQSTGRKIPPNMFPVKALPSGSAAGSKPAAKDLRIARGQFFSYALPEGWRVGEDGQFALTLLAPDSKALTIMVGNAGLPRNYPPGQFVHDKLMAIRPEALRIGEPRPASPATGFASAFQFDVAYMVRNVPCRGVVKCNVAPAYDTAVMAMTGALSEASQWAGYSSWLPLVADQISATNGAAFGMRGIMAQNLQNSTAYAEAARQYRDWSQRNWQQVTDARNASEDRKNFQVRENLGGIQTYVNPYDTRTPLELPATYQYFWVDRQGNILGTNDSSANPNSGSTADWKQMPRRRP